MKYLVSQLLRIFVKAHLRLYENGDRTPAVRSVILGDLISRKIILDGMYEHRELAVLSRELFPLLARDSTALDIGANIGNHANYFADYFERVVAFEPNPTVATVLRTNSMARNFEVVEIGLSDAPGMLNFVENPQNIGASRITDEHSSIKIKVDKLDSLVEPLKLHDVVFVKIDVEGHEDRVIAGAAELLSTSQPVIAMEGLYHTDREKGARVSALLNELGYRHFYALSDGWDHMPRWLYHAIPKPIRKSRPLRLKPVDRLTGNDHLLAIVSATPIK
ncbi:MAG: FkbM family methyltransferase [Rhodobacteraceae bacterium]|nr:FkbM family methyltransferase [Paracoccaceae bacterium]